ncbi:MAG: 3-oxoacyl-[acyl-carrier-protein] synthase, KASII [uncultured Pseudonocardia sp.]|uniref:3-oxoacyl-[acyl-carrier-protein] synthase, KASII n=1 Tax=uncultured Pseudonocardia sp. TaxID=211455 RepID=A0A6J4QAE6_9PSEU|nr:MAG: 3-oxoacyl-[acyl-carrier-protein] synthase, KASII [uncultured Pseudonocardia sp.]
MIPIAISGVGMLSTLGRDPVALAEQLAVSARLPEAGPDGRAAAAIKDFDVRAELGRKGSTFLDRRTALTLVACRAALDDAGVDIGALASGRCGAVLGTTVGSARSSIDYARETFVQDPPHLVNPGLFPNTVMNCAAGQSAIRFGLKGVNATIAGGPVAFASVLRYCANLFRTEQADLLLGGAVEELTPHSSWLSRSWGRPTVPAGEGGAVFVLGPGRPGVRPDAEVVGVALGFRPGPGREPEAVGRCVRLALEQAAEHGHADPAADVATCALRGGADETLDRAVWRAVLREASVSPDDPPERLVVHDHVGECGSATQALELAAVLGRHRVRPGLDGRLTVLAAHSADGAVGALVVRGWSRDGGSARGDDRL